MERCSILRQALNPLAKSATTTEELVIINALKKTEDGEMFLHINGQEVEDRIIAYATTQNLEQLNTTTTWLCNGIICNLPNHLQEALGTTWAVQ
ncbi:hypothetical protein DSO57_1038983 [Entomophthora muscae]|uniref:Uncharacterized protein n=1 Tax=Entomophthora muscae TaxID=34485 RepID=A0ACC2RDC0_9FUNG|nr:hypothetical protein DSO57_1038983 [Entomophthora muscae]